MNCYFVKRAEGDFSETQRIKATKGHAKLAIAAYGLCARKYGVKDGRPFFNALRVLLKELGKAGYTENPAGWKVVGGRLIKFEDMTHQQLFASFASVQQTVGKWVWNLVPADIDLHLPLLEEDLVFKANDVTVVMELLFELLQKHKGHFDIDTERGMQYLDTRLLSKLNNSNVTQEVQ